jgi:hypothetical protein
VRIWFDSSFDFSGDAKSASPPKVSQRQRVRFEFPLLPKCNDRPARFRGPYSAPDLNQYGSRSFGCDRGREQSIPPAGRVYERGDGDGACTNGCRQMQIFVDLMSF